MNLIDRLAAKLSKINDVISETRVQRELYDAYLKHVGTYDAIRYDEIDASTLLDKNGTIKPIALWPTRSSIEGQDEELRNDFEKSLQGAGDDPHTREAMGADDPFVKSLIAALENK
jgi:hypothetical protein